MSSRKRKKVNKTEEPEKFDDRFVADFSFETVWVSTSHGGFTNLLKDDKQFYQNHSLIFGTILPILKKQKFVSSGDYIYKLKINNAMPHSHIIDEKDTLDLIYQVLKKALIKSKGFSNTDAERYIEQNILSEKIYQIGFSSIRIIGYFDRNVFVIILMDYHHLIYPSIHHNQEDYKKYSLCPFEKGEKK